MVIGIQTQFVAKLKQSKGLDAMMKIPDGGGGTSVCDLLLRAIPTSIIDFHFQRRQPLKLACCKAETKNTGPLGLLELSLLAADTTGDSGIGTGSECGGERPSGGGGHVTVIDLVVGGSGGTSHHSVTPAGLKQSAIEKVSTPANWLFDTMLTWTRAQAMTRMTDNFITDSERKKACTVRTVLANNFETYISIVRDMIPGAPASQDVLEVCLTQASLEAKK